MTWEEAIEYAESKKMRLEALAYNDDCKYGNYAMYSCELSFVNAALTALRPVSREQVEKVWRGQWVKCKHADYYVCNKCSTVSKTGEDEFCKSCGAPMTDESVEMVMERMEALYEQ